MVGVVKMARVGSTMAGCSLEWVGVGVGKGLKRLSSFPVEYCQRRESLEHSLPNHPCLPPCSLHFCFLSHFLEQDFGLQSQRPCLEV